MASYLQESALADKLLQKIDEFLIVELPFLQGGSHVLCAIQADGAEGKKVEKLGKWDFFFLWSFYGALLHIMISSMVENIISCKLIKNNRVPLKSDRYPLCHRLSLSRHASLNLVCLLSC